jgi:hypothetical protein
VVSAELLEFIERDAKLAKDLVEQGRTNFLTGVNLYSGHASVGVTPSSVTPFCRVSTKPRMRATRWNSRAVALGIHYLGRICRESQTLFTILILDHAENIRQFCESLFSRFHQSVASRQYGNFGNPGAVFLTVQNYLVVFKFHRQGKYMPALSV